MEGLDGLTRMALQCWGLGVAMDFAMWMNIGRIITSIPTMAGIGCSMMSGGNYSIMIGRRIDVRVADCQRRITQGERAHDEKYMLGY